MLSSVLLFGQYSLGSCYVMGTVLSIWNSGVDQPDEASDLLPYGSCRSPFHSLMGIAGTAPQAHAETPSRLPPGL